MSERGYSIFISPEGDDCSVGSLKAPLATLKRALDIVAERKGHGDVSIYFRSGIYYLHETAVIDRRCQPEPGCSLIISSWNNEEVILSGGVPLSDWERAGLDEKRIWRTEVPWVKESGISFHALFKKGKLLKRARSHSDFSSAYETTRPSVATFVTDFCTTAEARREFHFPEGSVKKNYSLEDLEIFMSPQRPWLVNYLSLKSIDFEKNAGMLNSQATYELKGKFILENHVEFISGPGEWALDSSGGHLYYRPHASEPEEGIVAPRLEELIRVEGINDLEGERDQPVSRIRFEGLTFSHCDRETVKDEDKGLQHDWAMWDKANALVRFRGAEDCSVTNCRLENSGSCGVRLDLYCQNIEISDNVISNVGSMGIVAAGYGPGYKDVNKNNIIKGNEISNTGTLYGHAMGIYIWQSGGNLISRNHVHDLGYMGIVLSGVRRRFWNRGLRPRDIRELIPLIDFEKTGHLEGGEGPWSEYEPFMHTRNNIVESNEIHDCMKRLGDGNTIYLSAVGPGNIIRGNLAHSHKINFLMRSDDDTFDSHWENNILIGSSSNPRGFTHKGINSFDNNILINCALGVYTGPHGPTEGIHSIQKNIFLFTSPVKGNPLNDKSGFAPGKIDRNIFWSADPEELQKFLDRRKKSGSDFHSLVADPGFNDIEALDFAWNEDSPAVRMGITSVDHGILKRLVNAGGLKISGTDDLLNMIVG